MRNSKIYSKLDSIPRGSSDNSITEGCLVLEGGAFRGVYSQGVLDAMLEENINMQSVVGVSAGALGGMNYVSGNIGRSARINLRYRNDSNYVSFRHLKEYGGVINFDFLLGDIPNEPFNFERFEDERRRYVAVATNCHTGKAEYFERGKCTDIMKAIQASASMPFVSKMVSINLRKYLDGGCSVKIPYQWALEEGYEKIVVVRTRHRDYRYKNEELNLNAIRLYGKRYPHFARSQALTNKRYNDDCEKLLKLEKEGRIFVIAPSEEWTVGRLESDMEKLGDWYYLGYNDAKRRMEELKAYLG